MTNTTFTFNGIDIDIHSMVDDRDHKALDRIMAGPLAYLVGYGYKQSLQDVVSGVEKKVKDTLDRLVRGEYSADADGSKAKDRDHKDVVGWLEDVGEGWSIDEAMNSPDKFAKAVAKAMQVARRDDILKGEVGTRTNGPRLTGIDKVMRDVGTEMVRAMLVGRKAKANDIQGFTEMTEAAAMRSLVDRYLAKNEANVRAEAQRRLDAMSAPTGVDELADLLA